MTNNSSSSKPEKIPDDVVKLINELAAKKLQKKTTDNKESIKIAESPLVTSQALKYQASYKIVFDKLIRWKQVVVTNCSAAWQEKVKENAEEALKILDDRVWTEFAQDVIRDAEVIKDVKKS
jgi:hypothetical protein